MMSIKLKRVIYISEHRDYSNQNLKNIIQSSQKNNPSKEITGCLISGTITYLQLLEGPSASVDELYTKIKTDKRHENILMVVDEIVHDRLFKSWSMRLDPFNNLMWVNEELSSGNFSNITPTQAINIFTRISEDSVAVF